jgi:HlyD family secretion protein
VGGAGANGASAQGPASPDQRTVWVARGERPVPVRVKTGVSDGTLTDVVDGPLQPGDAVVTDATAGGAKPQGGSQGGRPRRLF